MSADDRTETEWAVLLPDGTAALKAGKRRALESATENTKVLQNAGSTQRAQAVTRLKSITYSEWEAVDE